MNMDIAHIGPLHLLKPTRKCLRTSMSPGLILDIVRYCTFLFIRNMSIGNTRLKLGKN